MPKHKIAASQPGDRKATTGPVLTPILIGAYGWPWLGASVLRPYLEHGVGRSYAVVLHSAKEMAVAISSKKIVSPRSHSEQIFSQGLIEKAFPAGPDEACTERMAFTQKQGWQEPPDGGFAMRRGLFAGALAEHELQGYASGHGFSVGLGDVADTIIKTMNFGKLGLDRQQEIRDAGVRWVRDWQQQFPQDGGDLDLNQPLTSLLVPQTDMFVRRPDRFAIRVRPDNIVGVGNTLVAWEWSTAKDPHAISRARFALNHHALLRERLRRPDWESFTSISTRVEMLALGVGFTVSLSLEDAEIWRVAIGKVAEAVARGEHEPNRGPHCSTCPWQADCWFGNNQDETVF